MQHLQQRPYDHEIWFLHRIYSPAMYTFYLQTLKINENVHCARWLEYPKDRRCDHPTPIEDVLSVLDSTTSHSLPSDDRGNATKVNSHDCLYATKNIGEQIRNHKPGFDGCLV